MLDGPVRRVPVRAGVDEEVLHDPGEKRRIEVERPSAATSAPAVERDGRRRRLLGDAASEPLDEPSVLLSQVGQAGARDVEQVAEDRIDGAELLLDVVERRRGRLRLGRPSGARPSREAVARDLERDAARAPSGDRSSWLIAPSSSRWPRTIASMRSAMRLKLDRDVAHLLGDPAAAARPATSVRTARSPPPKRSAACARCSSGRASWLATPPAIAESATTTSKSASTNLHQAHGTGRGPKRSISRAPSSALAAHDGHEDVLRTVGRDGPAALGDALDVAGQAARIADEAHVEAGDVAHLADVGARRDLGSSQSRARRVGDVVRQGLGAGDAAPGRVVETTRPLVSIARTIAPKNQRKRRDRSECVAAHVFHLGAPGSRACTFFTPASTWASGARGT